MSKNTETMLMGIDLESEEQHLTMMDGSRWMVNPSDLPTVVTWTTPVTVNIKDTEDGAMYSYEITIIDEGTIVDEDTVLDEDLTIRAWKIG